MNHFLAEKQVEQYTGRSPRGLKGTLAIWPHWAHITSNVSLAPDPPLGRFLWPPPFWPSFDCFLFCRQG